MNFKTYLDILEDEVLKESPLADSLLIKAMNAQKQIKHYESYEKTESIQEELKRLEEIKITAIWEAIDLARAYPPESDMYKLSMRAFHKRNKRQFKGFLTEYKMMKGR